MDQIAAALERLLGGGSCPLVTVYLRERDGSSQAATNVEDDTTTYRFCSEKERPGGIDNIAFSHWSWHNEDRVERVTLDMMPEHVEATTA